MFHNQRINLSDNYLQSLLGYGWTNDVSKIFTDLDCTPKLDKYLKINISMVSILPSSKMRKLKVCITFVSPENSLSLDFLLCRFCGYNVAPASTLLNIHSPAATTSFNKTLFGLKGVEVQSIQNPLGVYFDIVTSTGATCVPSTKHKWQIEHSWYPGYAWKICLCSKCQKHIGWVFEPLATASDFRTYASQNGFYALVLHNIISESFVDSLMSAPKITSSYT